MNDMDQVVLLVLIGCFADDYTRLSKAIRAGVTEEDMLAFQLILLMLSNGRSIKTWS